MSAWKEWQLALANDDISEEECEERRMEWERECREDETD